MNGVGSIHSTLQNVKNLGKVTASAYSSQEEPLSALPQLQSDVSRKHDSEAWVLGLLGPSAPRTTRGDHRGEHGPTKST